MASVSGSPADQPFGLWQRALGKLDADLRDSLAVDTSTKQEIVQKTLHVAKQKRDICLARRWKFRKGSREIIVRDVVEKIIRWLDHFKSVGDVASQYDPAHASLPWAGVRFLLQAAISDTQIYGSTIEGLETVSRIIARSSLFERVHLSRNNAASADLESCLADLYAELMIYMAKAKKFFETPTATRLLKSVVVAFHAEEDNQIRKIQECETKMSMVAAISDADTLNQLQELERPINRAAEFVDIYEKKLERQRFCDILNWLSCVDYREDQNWYSKRLLQNSGEWLLNSQGYIEWKASSISNILLLHGIAGSGKTSLVATIVCSHIQEASRQHSPAPMAYFYCSKAPSDPDKAEATEIMRSIVRQLAVYDAQQSSIHSFVVNEYETRENEAKELGFKATKLSLLDCTDMILKITALNPATIIVDAINEISPRSRFAVVSAFQRLIAESDNIIKIIMTSQDNHHVLTILPDVTQVRIHSKDNFADIERFVDNEISLAIRDCRLLDGKVSDTFKQALVKALLINSGESFQLATLQIERLCHIAHESDVREAMSHLHQDTLNSVYTEFLHKIRTAEEKTKRIATCAFSILLCAHERLSSEVLIAAVNHSDTVEENELSIPELQRICFNMVIFDKDCNTIRFVHPSVQEFIEIQPEFTFDKANELFAISCLKTLLYATPYGLEHGPLSKDILYHYSMIYWPRHCKDANLSSNKPELFHLVNDFMFDGNETSGPFITWLEDAKQLLEHLPGHHSMKKGLYAGPSQQNTPFFIICFFGFADLIERAACSEDFNWDCKNELGMSGVYLACSSGQQNVLSILLDHNVDINSSGGRHGNPLQAACFEGYLHIVELLLASGADSTTPARFKSALHASIEGNQQQIATTLIQRGYEISDQTEYDDILFAASQAGQEETVKHLQSVFGSSFGELGSSSCKAIQTAIVKGHVSVLSRFIRNTQQPLQELPPDAVALAALGGHSKMIEVLLEVGSDIEQEGQFGTALRAASLKGHESVVRLLLNRGAVAAARSASGNALEAAAMNGHSLIATLLIDFGVSVDIDGGRYGTPLQTAAYRGHLNVIKLLLDNGADLYQHGYAPDVFHATVEGGHVQVANLLLDRGFQFRNFYFLGWGHPKMMKKREGVRNPLRESSPSSHRRKNELQSKSSIFKRRVKRGYPRFDLEDTLAAEGDVFINAASKGDQDILKLLFDEKHSLLECIDDTYIESAFYESCENGLEETVALFLNHGKDLCPYVPLGKLRDAGNLDGYVPNALKVAAWNGHLSIVNTLYEYFLKSRQRLELRTEYIETCESIIQHNILIPGCQMNQVTIVKRGLELLNQSCFDIDVKELYKAALLEAFRRNSISVVELFLESNHYADDNIKEALRISRDFERPDVLVHLLDLYPRGHLAQYMLNQELEIAASKGWTNKVKALVLKGADPNARLGEISSDSLIFDLKKLDRPVNRTAFHSAILGLSRHSARLDHPKDWTKVKNFENTILFLIDSGAQIDETAECSKILLHLLLKFGSYTVINTTFNAGLFVVDSSWGLDTLELVARRELESWSILEMLMKLSKQTENDPLQLNSYSLKILLHCALAFFDESSKEAKDPWARFSKPILDNRFRFSSSIKEILEQGPGAVVRNLLPLIADEPTEDQKYGIILQMAVTECDYQFVNILLKRGIDVNLQQGYYGTALQCAARYGNLKIVRLLVEKGANVNITGGRYGTALRAAVLSRDRLVVDLLLAHGAQPTLLLPSPGDSIIKLAVESGELSIIRLLVAHGAFGSTDVNNFGSLLREACFLDDLEMVTFLLENETIADALRQDSKGKFEPISGLTKSHHLCDDAWASAIHMACAQGNPHIIAMLLKHGANVNLESNNPKGSWKSSSMAPLQVTVYSGQHDIIPILINAGVDVNRYNIHGTALEIATKKKRINTVKLLLGYGASVVNEGGRYSALYEACSAGSRIITRILLDALPVEEKSIACGHALQAAATSKQDDIFQLLVSHGSIYSTSALSVACSGPLENSMHWLLQVGVDVNAIDDQGGCPLHVACSGRHWTAIEILLRHGADVNLVSPKYGNSLQAVLEGPVLQTLRMEPQYKTAYRRELFNAHRDFRKTDLNICERIVRELIHRGANINPPIRYLGSPLHLACDIASLQIVQLLVKEGADLNSNSEEFGTPFMAAERRHKFNPIVAASEKNLLRIMEFLRENGAKETL